MSHDTDVLGPNDLPKPDLELVTTEALLNELKRRHDACLFLSVSDLTSEHEQLKWSWKGGSTLILGAMQRVRRRILKATD